VKCLGVIATALLCLCSCTSDDSSRAASVSESSITKEPISSTTLDPDPGTPKRAAWHLDPSVSVAPASTALDLIVTELWCSGARPATGRISSHVTYEADSIMIAVDIKPLDGPQPCPANPSTPYTVQLDEPLGNRAIYGQSAD